MERELLVGTKVARLPERRLDLHWFAFFTETAVDSGQEQCVGFL